jgi:hypothetical protein
VRQQPGHRHSIFCILPPHVLRDIAQTGSEDQRQAALETLAADSTFRTLRAIRQAAPVATASPATVTHSAVAGTALQHAVPGFARLRLSARRLRRLVSQSARAWTHAS